jgi:hypothetical protein
VIKRSRIDVERWRVVPPGRPVDERPREWFEPDSEMNHNITNFRAILPAAGVGNPLTLTDFEMYRVLAEGLLDGMGRSLTLHVGGSWGMKGRTIPTS